MVFMLLGATFSILGSMSFLAEKTYDKQENLTKNELSSLSVQPIKKSKINGLDYYYI